MGQNKIKIRNLPKLTHNDRKWKRRNAYLDKLSYPNFISMQFSGKNRKLEAH